MENWLGEVRRLIISKFKNVFTFKTKSSLWQQRIVCAIHKVKNENICKQQPKADYCFKFNFKKLSTVIIRILGK